MTGRKGPRTADRTLEILETVAASAHPVSAKALARSLGCGLSTVYALLSPLTDRGYLVRGNGGYALGYQVSALHRSFRCQMGLDNGIHAVLARLRQAARAPATYVAYQGDGLLIADVATASVHGETPGLDVGVDPRTHAHAHGKIALAAAGPATRRRYLDRSGLRRFTPNTISSEQRLTAELRRVRRDGLAVDFEEARPGMACLAAPVLGPDGSLLGALSLSVRPEELRSRREQLAAAVRRAAHEAQL
ncbi:IclR family transcriptional regulator C-terminal domain-containing protein [Streptomyces pathocidini]|uniref:IclR family transcriptional regulator n=1 Tax=Streptomyces pathocidini TaxID=1650571 RepID=UPI0033E878C1